MAGKIKRSPWGGGSELPENVYKKVHIQHCTFCRGTDSHDFQETHKGLYNPQKLRNHKGEVRESTVGP